MSNRNSKKEKGMISVTAPNISSARGVSSSTGAVFRLGMASFKIPVSLIRRHCSSSDISSFCEGSGALVAALRRSTMTVKDSEKTRT
jgi:hypothetical protein